MTWAFLCLINEYIGIGFLRPTTELLIIPPVKLLLKQLLIDQSGYLKRTLPKTTRYYQFFM